MGALITLLAKLVSALFSAWLGRPDPIAAESEEKGEADADLAVSRAALEAQWRVTQAAESAPKNDAQVDDLLGKGEA